ncbi:hypothetical protein ZOSMA_548G00080 [Zostera marina]|uniref:Uncharacterized protein n=1 Tax=Zostera marina TaxID=29655 RepID=A0A0K9NWR0_ZOSMR|nr:hypothetical protein ZOSMA_548G00080 [Zostera marina]
MGEVVMKEEPFVEMLLADGCFILHYILKESKKIKSAMVEQTPGILGVELQMYYDLLLLENQIPFFVVQELYTIFQSIKEETQIVAIEEEQSTLIDLAQNLFNKHHNYSKNPDAVKNYYSGDCVKVNHLLDLFHRSFTPTLPALAAPNGKFPMKRPAPPCLTPISKQDILPTSISDINVNVHPRITGSLTSSSQIKLSWVPNVTELIKQRRS